jgi:hypothetical protein
MSCAWERREASLARAIRQSIYRHTHPARGRWGFEFVDGPSPGISGILDDDWFLVESAWPSGASMSPEDLLRAQEGLGGLNKFVDPGHGLPTCVQAEIPVGDGIPFVARLGETLSALFAAQGSAASIPQSRPPVIPESPEPSGQSALAKILRETRWSHHERDDASIAVDLESNRGYRQARLVVSAGGDFSARVEMADWRSPSTCSRAAAARMLLCANHATRMARAAAREEEDRWRFRFEVRLGTPPSERELHHVLGTLSVACRQWTRELRALEEDSIARAYLAARAVGVEDPAAPEHQPHGR